MSKTLGAKWIWGPDMESIHVNIPLEGIELGFVSGIAGPAVGRCQTAFNLLKGDKTGRIVALQAIRMGCSAGVINTIAPLVVHDEEQGKAWITQEMVNDNELMNKVQNRACSEETAQAVERDSGVQARESFENACRRGSTEARENLRDIFMEEELPNRPEDYGGEMDPAPDYPIQYVIHLVPKRRPK